MSKKRAGFRAWFYLRMGYSIYWSFLIMGINTLTVTYFLAIERAPFLQVIFPTFLHYVVIMPFFRLQSELLIKISNNEKLTEKELETMKELQEKMDYLLKGGYVGDPGRLKNIEDKKI